MAFKSEFVSDVWVGFCRGVAISTAVTAIAFVGLFAAAGTQTVLLFGLLAAFLLGQLGVAVLGPAYLLGGDDSIVGVGLALLGLIVVSLVVTTANRRKSATALTSTIITDLVLIGAPLIFSMGSLN